MWHHYSARKVCFLSIFIFTLYFKWIMYSIINKKRIPVFEEYFDIFKYLEMLTIQKILHGEKKNEKKTKTKKKKKQQKQNLTVWNCHVWRMRHLWKTLSLQAFHLDVGMKKINFPLTRQQNLYLFKCVVEMEVTAWQYFLCPVLPAKRYLSHRVVLVPKKTFIGRQVLVETEQSNV